MALQRFLGKFNKKNSIEEKKSKAEKKTDYFSTQPSALLYYMIEFLEVRDTFALMQVSKIIHSLTHFNSKNNLSYLLNKNIFINYVVSSEEGEIKKFLNTLKTQNITLLNQLLTEKINITDLSERTFQNITAFQYALWAYDAYMWQTLLQFLSKDEALKQLQELEECKVTYTFKSAPLKPISEKHYSGYPLFCIIENNADRARLEEKGFDCDNTNFPHFTDAQKNIPAHIAHEYCNPQRSFKDMPNFKDMKPIYHSLQFYNHKRKKFSSWYKDPDLIGSVAVFRGDNDKYPVLTHSYLVSLNFTEWFSLSPIHPRTEQVFRMDNSVLKRLISIRKAQYQSLKEDLIKKDPLPVTSSLDEKTNLSDSKISIFSSSRRMIHSSDQKTDWEKIYQPDVEFISKNIDPETKKPIFTKKEQQCLLAIYQDINSAFLLAQEINDAPTAFEFLKNLNNQITETISQISNERNNPTLDSYIDKLFSIKNHIATRMGDLIAKNPQNSF